MLLKKLLLSLISKGFATKAEKEEVSEKSSKSNLTEFTALIKSQQDSLLKVVSSVDALNKKLENLSQEIETLKEEPSERELTEATPVVKGLGATDDGQTFKTGDELDKEEAKEINAIGKRFANSGQLFAEKQKVRQKHDSLRAKLG